MKNVIKVVCLAWLFLAGCTKKDKLVVLQGGTAPVLSKSTTAAIILNKDNKDNNIVVLNWTNPNYTFNTGLSSQTVSYLIQVDKTGSDFKSNSLQEVSLSGDLNKVFTVGELNTILNKMELAAGTAHDLDVRIKSFLGTTSAPLYSNVVSLKVTPYLDFAVAPPGTEAGGYLDADLWVVGDAFESGFSNPLPAPFDVTQKFTRVDLLHYELVVSMKGGGAYKMIQKQGEWSTQYHALSGGTWEAGSFEKRDADPGFPGAPSAGTYKISINFQTGRYTVVKQ